MARNRYPTLEEYDGDHWQDEGHSPYSTGRWGIRQAARAALARRRPQRAVETIGAPLIADRCWCGEQYNHDWPGKSEGGPHPRKK